MCVSVCVEAAWAAFLTFGVSPSHVYLFTDLFSRLGNLDNLLTVLVRLVKEKKKIVFKVCGVKE